MDTVSNSRRKQHSIFARLFILISSLELQQKRLLPCLLASDETLVSFIDIFIRMSFYFSLSRFSHTRSFVHVLNSRNPTSKHRLSPMGTATPSSLVVFLFVSDSLFLSSQLTLSQACKSIGMLLRARHRLDSVDSYRASNSSGPPGAAAGGGGNKRLAQQQAQVDEVVDIMRQNVDKVLERDKNLSLLDDRAGKITCRTRIHKQVTRLLSLLQRQIATQCSSIRTASW